MIITLDRYDAAMLRQAITENNAIHSELQLRLALTKRTINLLILKAGSDPVNFSNDYSLDEKNGVTVLDVKELPNPLSDAATAEAALCRSLPVTQ